MGTSLAREMRELERVQHRYDSRTGSVARQFDHICAVLSNLGYLQPVRESAGMVIISSRNVASCCGICTASLI